MDDSYATAREAIAAIKDGKRVSDEHILALAELVSLFEPYKGDPIDQVESDGRKLQRFTCTNCGFHDVGPSAPANLLRWANAGIRRSICPLCYCTNMTIGEQHART